MHIQFSVRAYSTSFILSVSMCSVAAQVYSLVRAFAIHLFHKYQNFIITSSNNIIGRLTFLTLFILDTSKKVLWHTENTAFDRNFDRQPLKIQNGPYNTMYLLYQSIYGIVHQDEKRFRVDRMERLSNSLLVNSVGKCLACETKIEL